MCSYYFIMEHGILENINISFKYQSDISDSYKLKRIVLEIQKTLLLINDYNSIHRLSLLNKDNYVPLFNNAKERIKNNQFISNLDQFKHKLIRIQREFEFIKRNARNYQKLTPREKEIVQLLVNGSNNPNIADNLFISRSTVEQHRKHINKKLKIKSVIGLIQYAYAFNII